MPLASWEEPGTDVPLAQSMRLRSIALASSVLLLLANWYLPYKVRFTYAPLNNMALILLLGAIPVALIGFGTSLRPWWIRWPTVTLGLTLLPPIGLFALVSGFDAIVDAAHGGDAAFEQIAELRIADGTYRVYRTDGGAMTDFGLVLRREYTVFPGVRLVSVLMSQYHASDAMLDLTRDGMVRLEVMAYGNHPAFVREFPP